LAGIGRVRFLPLVGCGLAGRADDFFRSADLSLVLSDLSIALSAPLGLSAPLSPDDFPCPLSTGSLSCDLSACDLSACDLSACDLSEAFSLRDRSACVFSPCVLSPCALSA